MSLTPTESPAVDRALTDQNRDVPAQTMLDPALEHDTVCDGCGYNLRGLARSARCPECGEPVARSVSAGAALGRSDRRWATLVFLGLTTLLITFPSQVWVIVQMHFSGVAFGTAPRLNIPGPKIWAVPLVQRSLGYSVETLGAEGTWMSLAGVVAMFLIATPRRSLAQQSRAAIALSLASRWLPPMLIGGFFGFLMNAEGTYDNRGDIGRYANFGVALVELPCTALLLLTLARICRDLRVPAIRQQFLIAAAAAAAIQAASVAMISVAPYFQTDRHRFQIQVVSAFYEAACVIVALIMFGAMLRLMVELFTRVMPQRARAWFA